MSADSEPIARYEAESAAFDFDAVFRLQYARVARIVARLVQDPGRAEEIAVEVFWKLLKHPGAHGPRVEGWLYRTAVRAGLDELRKRGRRQKYERLSVLWRTTPTPEQLYLEKERARRVQTVLSRLSVRQAELLFLRSDGWSYQELAEALELNPASVGTLLRRAQQAFQKEYMRRYGQEHQRR